MRTLLCLIAMALTPSLASAQTTITARTGAGSEPYVFAEALHQYDNGLLTGAGYAGIDTPNDNRETWAGLGATFRISGVRVLAVAHVDQTSGNVTDPQTSILPWLLATKTVGRVIGTANYFVYTPVGDGEAVQVLEHAKTEYRLSTRWLAGAGYAGRKAGDGAWVSKPFVTATYESKLGAFEVWAQRPGPGEETFQLRYKRAF